MICIDEVLGERTEGAEESDKGLDAIYKDGEDWDETDISEGREIFKPRQLPGSAIWSIKVGRGSGFPGKRRPRGAGLSGRGGRGRSKLKSGIGAVVLPGVSTADISSNKDDEENSMHTTVVLFSSSDKFTLNQV
nr:histone-lysine N-methyltransferase 2C-like [Gorilla gorilla gorilla]